MNGPSVKYARSGDVAIAYQVVGDGPVDLVFVPFMVSMIFSSPYPPFSSFVSGLARFSRLILFDKRGIGASDRPRTPPTLEAQMDDVRAVMDAVGTEQAALFGAGHGGQMCALFAATYPERTSALILYNPWQRFPGTAEDHRRIVRRFREEAGTDEAIERVLEEQYPSLVNDAGFRRVLPMVMRASASPGAAAEFMRTVVEADVSEVLPAVRVPTLILYRGEADAGTGPIEMQGREARCAEVAAAIPNARVVAVPGRDMALFVGEEIPEQVEAFLQRGAPDPVLDRVLATVLFTDIVGSTERAVQLGDREWVNLLAVHRAAVRQSLSRFGGVELDTAGDGFFASFDGPARAIASAREIVDTAERQGVPVRAGIHTGECDREGAKLAGIAVHLGARIAAQAAASEILVSQTVKDLVAGSGIEFDHRGDVALKGIPGTWTLFAVGSAAKV
jgi:class 3 adenylate cyclase